MLQAPSTMRYTLLALLTAAALVATVHTAGEEGREVIQIAMRAAGADGLRTLRYAGGGFSFTFGQSASPGAPWPRFSANDYTRELDFAGPSSRVQFIRTAVDRRGGGGIGLPIVNQPQTQTVLPGAPWAQLVDVWLTPYGFLRHAAERPVTL